MSVPPSVSDATEDRSKDLEQTDDPDVLREILEFESSFVGIASKFQFLEKVGEGTFSCVYKAVDLTYDQWDHSWQRDLAVSQVHPRVPELVAVKRIHATSSPTRIANELDILATLAHSRFVSHIITAMRYSDQVLLIMPYIEFSDFRSFYRTGDIKLARQYMHQLLQGLEFVHDRGVIHRDVKPTNFLFNVETRNGVLVDFGLAEFSRPNEGNCLCQHGGYVGVSHLITQGGYVKGDNRPSRRANRAGTRGFRAPEVVLKCTRQTNKIDVWSAGAILLMLLSRRFPFFNPADDSDALVELATLFGKNRMKEVAVLHGAAFETNITTIRENGVSLEEIVAMGNYTVDPEGHVPSSAALSAQWEKRERTVTTIQEDYAIDLARRLLEPDFRHRITAADAVNDPWFTADWESDTHPGAQTILGVSNGMKSTSQVTRDPPSAACS